jgi:hypothetical protein
MLTSFKTKKIKCFNWNTRGGNIKNEKESLEAELQTLKVRITTGESHVASLKTEVQTLRKQPCYWKEIYSDRCWQASFIGYKLKKWNLPS